MITEDKITEIFCAVDEFCKEFDKEMDKKSLMSSEGTPRRYRRASLSESEIMTILIAFQFGSFRNFKHYYLFYIRQHLRSYFPNAVSYNRFVELESRVFFQMMFFLNLSAFGKCSGISFVDSTMIPVCHNLRRYANRVFRGAGHRRKGNDGMVSRFQAALCLQRQGGNHNLLLYRCPCGRQESKGVGRPSQKALRKVVCRQGIHIAQTLRHALRGRHTLGHGNQKRHEEQAHAHVGQNHVTKEVHHRDHQRHAQEYGTTRAFKAQVGQ